MAIVDAITDTDLMTIGAACKDLPLITGGSGVAMGLPEVYRAQGWLAPQNAAAATQAVAGQAAVLSGSCSAATLEQVARFADRRPCFRVDPWLWRPAMMSPATPLSIGRRRCSRRARC